MNNTTYKSEQEVDLRTIEGSLSSEASLANKIKANIDSLNDKLKDATLKGMTVNLIVNAEKPIDAKGLAVSCSKTVTL